MDSWQREITIPCLFLLGKYDLVVPPALGTSAFNLVNTTQKVQFCFSVSHCIKTYHHNGHYNELGEWIEAWDQLDDFRIFCQGDCDPDVADAGTNLEKMKLAVVGKEFSIYLPMEINGKKVTKTFSFRVEDVKEWKE